MTQEAAKILWPIIKAWSEGKVVQVQQSCRKAISDHLDREAARKAAL